MKLRASTWGLILLTTVAAAGCRLTGNHNLPPAQMLMEPGPGVSGPGPGVLQPAAMMPVQGAVSQVAFVGPEGMQASWDVSGIGQFDSVPLVVPGRNNFPQGGIYRMKLTSIPGREGTELYPTLEVGPATPRTEAFLAHNSVPVQFTEEDFDQVMSGNFVTKVIYLPDSEFQELALAGVETLVSTRLDPGVDPIVEADRRGAILAIVRLGNKDLEMPGADDDDGLVMPASFAADGYGGHGGALATPGHVAGVTTPQYGMPISGTPIGLPGPPHIPLGVPAGMRRHTITNHTRVSLPRPTKNVSVSVKQTPGLSYPKPAHKVSIRERTFAPRLPLLQPLRSMFRIVR